MTIDETYGYQFSATIYLGLKERATGSVYALDDVRAVLQGYCNDVGFCVSLTSTEFIYKDGGEPGVTVGIINYLRFPHEADALKQTTRDIAHMLIERFKQCRVSVVFHDETLMLSNLSLC